ncbi:hypothetical protein BC629DRAFT_629453 [Irpex lacteus]|nr:hypothetical protein BC629DRAFT_629453 [Irpex lacteus]
MLFCNSPLASFWLYSLLSLASTSLSSLVITLRYVMLLVIYLSSGYFLKSNCRLLMCFTPPHLNLIANRTFKCQHHIHSLFPYEIVTHRDGPREILPRLYILDPKDGQSTIP